MRIIPAFRLEQWYSRYQYSCDKPLCSSGVRELRLGELLRFAQVDPDALLSICLEDSDVPGSHELRRTVAELYPGMKPENVLITHGAIEALFLTFCVLLEPGDRVCVPWPSFESFHRAMRIIGVHVMRAVLDRAEGFRYPTDRVVRNAHKAKIVVLNFPNNPTGSTLLPQELMELTARLIKAGCWVLSDEVFRELDLPGHPRLPTLAGLDPRVIVVGSLSKTYGLPGLRVGWVVADKRLIEAMRRLKDYVTLNISPLSEYLAIAAIRARDCIIAYHRRRVGQNLKILVRWAEKHKNLIQWFPPSGGVCCFPRLANGSKADPLCHRLAGDGVFLLPGSCFGFADHFRLGYGGATREFKQGLSFLSRAL